MITTDFDICECGDYRRQHKDDWGTCSVCGEGPTGGSPLPCRQFRIFQTMRPTWAVVR